MLVNTIKLRYNRSMSSYEGHSTDYESRLISLQSILAKELNRSVTKIEAFDFGYSLIEFYEALKPNE